MPLQSAEGEASFVCQCCEDMQLKESWAPFLEQPTQNAENFKLEATMQTIITESSVCTNHMAIRMGSYVHTRKQRSNRCFRTHKHSKTSDPIAGFFSFCHHTPTERSNRCFVIMTATACMHIFFSYRVHSLSTEKILARSSFATNLPDVTRTTRSFSIAS